MRRIINVTLFLFMLTIPIQAQSFSSGSTGADGALDLSTMNCPNNVCKVQLPESGVLNYTTVNVPSGKELRFRRNARNTPVILLAQGNVTIAGSINVENNSDPDTPATGRTPGPGGFYGGIGEQPGFGPGGGQVAGFSHGRWVGPLSLVPIIGGSGGAGVGCTSCGGSGGAGAIAIASSTSITLSGSISARSVRGNGSTSFGAAGAIRLVANSITVSGQMHAFGTSFIFGECGGPCNGLIRVEAPAGSLTFTGFSTPAAVLSPINPVIVSSTPPSLTIVSIGGFTVPSYAGQRFDTIDVLLPNQLTDPITVVVQGNNIPVGTPVSIEVVNGSPNATTVPSILQGTFESSTALPTISNLTRTSVTYLQASVTFEPPAGPSNPKGANHVEKVKVVSVLGAAPKYIFLRKDGTEIPPEKLSQEFLQHFGL